MKTQGLKTQTQIKINGKNFATEKRALKAIEKINQLPDTNLRFFIHHNPETNRFHPVLVGAVNLDYIHDGFMVIA